jgi:predicted metal-dependent peptidase
MPGRIHYEKEMAVVVSIDQSGSMSDADLEKINYVVTQLAKKSVFTEILLHDTRVAERKRFQGKKFQGIRDFVTNRVAFGGTSHREVFSILKEIKDEKKSRKIIYLSFSDNYSDIESVYDPETFNGIPAYWIVTTGGKPVDVPGMQISLEEGLLQH